MTITPERQATREVHRTEIDGVPVFWADVPGPFFGSLVFGTGSGHETLATSGLSHLVEHLALWQFAGDQPYEYNGMVEPMRTAFFAEGRPEQVADFLTKTASALADLPLDKFENERRILETEEDGGSAGPVTFHRFLRYGATGLGLSYYRQLGLARLTAEDVGAWAAENFTQGNAAVWLTGPPPDDLRLPLQGGERTPNASSKQIDHTYPMFVEDEIPFVSISLVAARGAAVPAGTRIAIRRLQKRLRYEQGLSYDVCSVWDVVDRERGLVTLWADCLDDNAQTCCDELLNVFRELSEAGPTEEELAEEVERQRQMLDDPDSLAGYLDLCVDWELVGRTLKSEAELLAEDEALTPADVAAALGEALATAIVAAPEVVGLPPGFHEPDHDQASIQGEEFWEKRPLRERRQRGRFVVGDQGVAWVAHTGAWRAVEFDRLVSLSLYEDGAFTVRRDCGCFVEVAPDEIADFDRAKQLVLDRVPPGLVITPRAA